MLVHYHAYGDAGKVPTLITRYSQRIRAQISQQEQEEIERLKAEYQDHAEKLSKLNASLADMLAELAQETPQAGKKTAEAAIKKLENQCVKPAAKVTECDERIAEVRRRAEYDRQEVINIGEELTALYANPDELLKHARVVNFDEIIENEFDLNISRYVDTFEPEPKVEVKEALKFMEAAESRVHQAEFRLRQLLRGIGYEN